MSSDFDFSFMILELDRLRAELGTMTAISLRQQADLTHLRALNAELMAALIQIIEQDHHNMGPVSVATEIARAAIAKAKEEDK